MNSKQFSKHLIDQFPYTPTNDQHVLINRISDFIIDQNSKNRIFLLKGYAGTGKTSIISTIVKNLSFIKRSSVLLAPTGRAAKVLSAYSGKHASTIHRKIYFLNTRPDGSLSMVLAKNKHKNTIFFVDEASMIPDNTGSSSLFTFSNLLEDLLRYIYTGENCFLILIGDSAQLPPVGLDISPALDEEFLKSAYPYDIFTYELTEVVRQSLDSGILANATDIRTLIQKEDNKLKIKLNNYPDIFKINGTELEDELSSAFGRSGSEETIVITRSNKRANIFNREIRNRILYQENEISSGDLLMVVKNNYFWLDGKAKPYFIANGDIIQIVRINKYEEFYGFRFADVDVSLPDYPDLSEYSVKIILDTIMIDGPALSQKDNNRLFKEVMKDYEDLPARRMRVEATKNNPWFNALQIKFAYCLTCHKTQGGQWETVFIDQGYLNDDMVNTEYFRWLYTAFTRATKKLYLVNFHEKFFE
jgi:exodeoxyribonuclease-5